MSANFDGNTTKELLLLMDKALHKGHHVFSYKTQNIIRGKILKYLCMRFTCKGLKGLLTNLAVI